MMGPNREARRGGDAAGRTESPLKPLSKERHFKNTALVADCKSAAEVMRLAFLRDRFGLDGSVAATIAELRWQAASHGGAHG